MHLQCLSLVLLHPLCDSLEEFLSLVHNSLVPPLVKLVHVPFDVYE